MNGADDGASLDTHTHTLCISSEHHRVLIIHGFLTPTLDCGTFRSPRNTKWHLISRSAQHGDGRIRTICLLNQPDSKSAVMSITAARLSGQQGVAQDAGYRDQRTRARTKLLFMVGVELLFFVFFSLLPCRLFYANERQPSGNLPACRQLIV